MHKIRAPELGHGTRARLRRPPRRVARCNCQYHVTLSITLFQWKSSVRGGVTAVRSPPGAHPRVERLLLLVAVKELNCKCLELLAKSWNWDGSGPGLRIILKRILPTSKCLSSKAFKQPSATFTDSHWSAPVSQNPAPYHREYLCLAPVKICENRWAELLLCAAVEAVRIFGSATGASAFSLPASTLPWHWPEAERQPSVSDT